MPLSFAFGNEIPPKKKTRSKGSKNLKRSQKLVSQRKYVHLQKFKTKTYIVSKNVCVVSVAGGKETNCMRILFIMRLQFISNDSMM